MIKKGRPNPRELVIATVEKVNPNSVFVKLKEYDAEGMIHISEVSSGWIKDIRHFVKIGQEIVAKVLNNDREVLLSMKRVSSQEKNSKIKNYRLEQRAEKLLEMAGQLLGYSAEKAMNEIGNMIIEKFGSIYIVFKLSVEKPEQLRKHMPDEWINVITEVAKKNIAQKEFELKARLFIRTTEPDGIKKIKDALKKAEKSGLSITYITAPEYLVKYSTKTPKKGMREFESKIQKITSSIEGRYEMIEDK
ncbi:MAG: S1 RNA-binding domain-containing protein [Candidatus Aenigmarchaeota archaeon]|nr:S1 RNA-binding domain-containing protein [Candidatus Aenigmarchaeota archaeon]